MSKPSYDWIPIVWTWIILRLVGRTQSVQQKHVSTIRECEMEVRQENLGIDNG